jgi:hypothetical protein
MIKERIPSAFPSTPDQSSMTNPILEYLAASAFRMLSIRGLRSGER